MSGTSNLTQNNPTKVKHILLVDDHHADNQKHKKIIKKILSPEKITVIRSGSKALDYLSDNQYIPGLIFLNISLPDIDVFQFIEAFKKLPETVIRQTKVILLSAKPDLSYYFWIKQSKHILKFLLKPLTEESLYKLEPYTKDIMLKILLLEDVESDVEIVHRILSKAKIRFDLKWVWKEKDFVRTLIEFMPDIVIADHSLPQFSSIDAFRIVKKHKIHVPFILFTGTLSEEVVSYMVKEGIDDYVLKSSTFRLPNVVENVLYKKRLNAEKQKLDQLNKQLQHAYKKLRHAYDQLAIQDKELNDSLNCARYIQQAVLPNTHTLFERFSDAFILYKPKSTLSGDFYWFAKFNEDFLMVMGDATGHGVPGALMATLGCSMLNEITHFKDVLDPATILSELNRKIDFSLKQTKNKVSHAGMVAAVCSIKPSPAPANRGTYQVEFAGAHRPCYLVRQGQLRVVKGDFFTIGGFQEKKAFTSHSLKLNKGDTLYLFSDGYPDQFGGPRNKKFTVARLKKILLPIQGKPMQGQAKILDKTITDWKGNLEQTDDILMMGVRFCL